MRLTNSLERAILWVCEHPLKENFIPYSLENGNTWTSFPAQVSSNPLAEFWAY